MPEHSDTNSSPVERTNSCVMYGALLPENEPRCPRCGEQVPLPPQRMSQGDFRWIVLLTAIIAIPGTVLVLAGLLGALVSAVEYTWGHPIHPSERRRSLALAMACAVIFVSGMTLLFAARCCWKRAWVLMGVALAMGVALFVLADRLDRWLVSHFL